MKGSCLCSYPHPLPSGQLFGKAYLYQADVKEEGGKRLKNESL